MKQLTLLLMITIGASSSTGCFFDRQPRTVVVKEKRGCGPAHHWDGQQCVHNGNGNGNGKGNGKGK